MPRAKSVGGPCSRNCFARDRHRGRLARSATALLLWIGAVSCFAREARAQAELPPIEIQAPRESTRHESAPPDVLRRYVGATATALAGGGFNGLTVDAVGGDVFVGWRLLPMLSLEGFFAYHFALQPSNELGGGGICTGSGTDQWNWQTIGVRLWIHLVRTRVVDVSIAPMVAAGLSEDRWRSTVTPASFCYQPPAERMGWALDAGLDFGVEVRPLRWLGIRATTNVSLDGGGAQGLAFGVASVSGGLGPVIRF